ncbi:MAG: 23S rRNA (adenine(2503)-C(2))-methyltransferase RlmN [Nitrospirota bacterium]
MQNKPIPIKSLPFKELQTLLVEQGFKKFRAAQIQAWIYKKYARSFDEMTNIAKPDRGLLASLFSLASPRILTRERSSDGTRKFLFQLEDVHTIESVLIPDENRTTLCISSQVGCSLGCRFCLTGSGGFKRNLLAYEIADQVLEASRIAASEGSVRISNIVLMGMGEPLLNFEEVLKALQLITSDTGLGFSPRRVTLSTAGIVPAIAALGKSGVRVNLAISLNATTDEVRDRIMPINKRYPLQELLAACRRFPLEPRRRITFEYVLLKGVNDSEQDARRLATMLHGIRCKINLIPFNPFPGSEFEMPDDTAVRRFQKILLDRGFTAPVRESRGKDISAACGQLCERTDKSKSADQG